jgi:hypothetical protein
MGYGVAMQTKSYTHLSAEERVTLSHGLADAPMSSSEYESA